MDCDPVQVDGSIMEGGGQILRMAMDMSALFGKRIRVHNIRAGRKVPGLRAQHLSGLELVRDICSGTLHNGNIGSTEITFNPGKIKSGKYLADAKTAGSVTLLAQVSLPCLFYADGPSVVVLKGGTDVDFAPPIDYFIQVVKPHLKHFGIDFNCDIAKRGYYPKGGGLVTIETQPLKQFLSVKLEERGRVVKICGKSFVAGVLPIKIAHQMAHEAKMILKKHYFDVKIDVEVVKEDPSCAVGSGSGIMLIAETDTGCKFAGSSIGKKGTRAEKVGQQAAEILHNNLQHGGCVDEYMQDQLIIFMALANGKSTIKSGPITLHTKTAIHIIELLTKAKFTITASETDETNIIECEGIGYQNNLE